MSIEIEDNNIPLSFDENSSDNLFCDHTEFNKNFYKHFPLYLNIIIVILCQEMKMKKKIH